ncbi:hypothetical protein SH139x_000107 [Planctomycetaceae bacterium SH139]
MIKAAQPFQVVDSRPRLAVIAFFIPLSVVPLANLYFAVNTIAGSWSDHMTAMSLFDIVEVFR